MNKFSIPKIWADAAQKSWDLYMERATLPLPDISEANMLRKLPAPIQFPAPRTFDERIRSIVRTEVYAALYAILHSEEELNIATMSQEEFETFCRNVTQDEDE